MSFLSVLKNAGKDILAALSVGAKFAIEAAPVAGEVVSLFDPPAGALISIVGTKILQAEAQFTAGKDGANKKAFVMAGLTDSINLAFGLLGKPVPQQAMDGLSTAVDSFVALMNSIHSTTSAAKS